MVDMANVQGMLDDLFQGKDKVSKTEVVDKARQSGVGDDVKGAAEKLPDGEYGKQDLMDKFTQMLGAKAGIGGGGGMGGMFGR